MDYGERQIPDLPHFDLRDLAPYFSVKDGMHFHILEKKDGAYRPTTILANIMMDIPSNVEGLVAALSRPEDQSYLFLYGSTMGQATAQTLLRAVAARLDGRNGSDIAIIVKEEAARLAKELKLG